MKTKSYQKLKITIAAAILILAGGVSWQFAAAQSEPAAQTDSTSVTTTETPPPDIAANAALVEIISLSQAGVSEGIITNYISNCQTPFNLTADQIIYLKDIGLPDSVVMAMIQRDQQLGEAAPATTAQTAPAPPPTTAVVSEDYFNDSLAPYGSWVVVEGYGRCWRPAVVVYNSGWQPYGDHGHWIYTDAGWYWDSDYSWGWATFHYGRWFRDAHLGWCWMPDTAWGPSWVCWRYSDDYCGWAPLPPHAYYREGVGLVYNGAHVSVGFDFGLSIGAFTFVSTSHFCDPHPWRYRVARTQETQIYNHTTVINDITVNNTTIINRGIPPERISERTHTPIHAVTIRESNQPVARGEQLARDGNTLVINRPHFSNDRNQPAPHNNNTVVPYNNRQNNPPNANNNNQFRQQPVAPQPQPPTVNNGGNYNERQPQAPVSNSENHPSPPVQQSPPYNYGAPYNSRPNNPPNANNNNQSGQQPFMSPRMQQNQPQSPPPVVNGGNHNERQPPPMSNSENHPSPPVQQPPPQHGYNAPNNRAPASPPNNSSAHSSQNDHQSGGGNSSNQRGNSGKDKNDQ